MSHLYRKLQYICEVPVARVSIRSTCKWAYYNTSNTSGMDAGAWNTSGMDAGAWNDQRTAQKSLGAITVEESRGGGGELSGRQVV